MLSPFAALLAGHLHLESGLCIQALKIPQPAQAKGTSQPFL